MKNQHILIINSLVLILLGIYGYVSAKPESKSLTAFIGPGVGIILLFFYSTVKKQNSTGTHIMVMLTLLTAVIFSVIGIIRVNILILIMAASSVISLIFYVSDFLKRKREREASKK